MQRKVISTDDGSKTIYLPHLDETYHSSNGAIQESLHIFINSGLRAVHQKEISVFEMGFGTGLNTLLASIFGKENKVKINYTGIEAYPIDFETAIEMDYCSIVEKEHTSLFEQMHRVDWGKKIALSDYFTFEKIHAKIEDYSAIEAQYDLVFFDAFGPQAQEEVWALPILQKMYDLLKPNGFLITYCAKGQVKRNLKQVGFEIEPLAGPPGKREITRAWKRNDTSEI